MLARQLGDRAAEVEALLNVAYAYVFASALGAGLEWRDPAAPQVPVTDPFEMIDLLEQGYAELGDEQGLARGALGRAHMTLAGGFPGAAIPVLEGLLGTFDRFGDVLYHAMTCDTLAWLTFRQGDWPRASRFMLRSVLDTYESGDLSTTTLGLRTGSILAAESGQQVPAVTLGGAFETWCDRYGIRPPAEMLALLDVGDPLQAAHAALPEEAFAAALERGRRMSLDEAVRLLTEVCDRVAASAPPT